ncbi:peptide ABC transporter substrate-binding protein [Aneurinibacillus sp. Ricciae_BoGa-3]|uniref:peptide ABC transporter substrate-binding protein n=1 Tax=Aneurinibacillus sp. Ricciae_BoGa-3 TaxID=3022697 RepID=UPI00233FDF09|nr:peptide ABC transporter substrate-binding protein [Aneurinibacillus sp. Ricciae_BoGa-3]WCK55568.1 peptide ABC transporter substrate-binding protein [Aneurinibacillus sp. Ricciae_BoGa-3]
MKKIASLMLSLLIPTVLIAAGCSSGQPTASKDAGKDKGSSAQQKLLMLNNQKEPTSLDPPVGFDEPSYDILNNAMEGLTRLDKDNKPQPAVAEKWDVSNDGKTYTFTLRQNAKWSNGDPVTAKDFEYAWKRMADAKTASEAAPLAYLIEGTELYNSGKAPADKMMVKAVNDTTLKVTLAHPLSYFLGLVSNPAFFPVDKAVVEKNSKWAAEANTMVCNGPFKITEWKHDDHLTMMKNDKYWDAANVKLDGVVWKMVNDSNTEYQLFQTGALHATYTIPTDMADQLFKDGKAKVADQSGTEFYRFNTKMKPFDNVKIRKAFNMAIDRQKLVDLVLRQKQKPATGFVAAGLNDPAGGDFRQVGGDLIKFDPAQAKQLLQQGMKEDNLTKLPTITLTYNTSDQKQKVAQVLQEMFKENLGVDVKLVNMEWKVLKDQQKKGQLMLSRSTFLADFGDPINFLDGFQSGNPMNRTGWSNAEYDKLIKAAYNEPDDPKRFKLMHDAEKILMDESPIMPLHFYTAPYLQNDNAVDIVRHPVGYIDLKWASLK